MLLTTKLINMNLTGHKLLIEKRKKKGNAAWKYVSQPRKRKKEVSLSAAATVTVQ